MNKVQFLSACLMLLSFRECLAVNLWCEGTVSRVYVEDDARLYIKGTWHASYSAICDLNTSWSGIAPETCKIWFAMLEAAHHAGGEVTVFYRDVPYASCADLPPYGSAPAPGYVMNRSGQ